MQSKKMLSEKKMLSWKRLMYVILIVLGVSSVFIVYNINEERAKNIRIQNSQYEARTFTDTRQIDEQDRPAVRLFGDPAKDLYRDIYQNTKLMFERLHFSVIEEDWLEPEQVGTDELVVFCDDSVGSYTNLQELGGFVARGGRVILAAGLPEGNEDSYLWPLLGIREKSVRENYNKLLFEEPLLPVQKDEMVYDGYNMSTWLQVDNGAKVYMRDAAKKVPLLYTTDYQDGKLCLINGTFLTDVRCLGLLTGAVGAVSEDFIYPVLGVKAVFLDDFPMITFINDRVCMRMYGCSTESFVRDIVWPSFQGISLRTATPYTSGILTVASSKESFPAINDSLFTAIGKSALQYDGELIYIEKCLKEDQICFNTDFITEFAEVFQNYDIRGMALQTEYFSEEMLDIPGAQIRIVRGQLGWEGNDITCGGRYTVFPAATTGNTMEDGNLFAISSVLAAYGMVSHVFDVNALIAEDENTASWDQDKSQLGVFEADILRRVGWLDGKTISQTSDDVRSYLSLDYGWKRDGERIELDCSGIVRGQAFLYRTDHRILEAQGLTYEEAGNGYYLLRVQENHAVIVTEGE